MPEIECHRSCGGDCEECTQALVDWSRELEARGIIGPWEPQEEFRKEGSAEAVRAVVRV